MTIPDRFITVNSVKTRYFVEGSGPPVLLIHGLGGGVECWLYTIGVLARHHTVYALDMIGFGLSDKPLDACYDIDSIARFTVNFLDALHLERVAIIGHSMGGALALRFALNYPYRVTRLGMLAPAGLGKEVDFPLRLFSLPLLGELLYQPSLAVSRQGIKAMCYDQSLSVEEAAQLHFERSVLPGAVPVFFKILRANMSIFGQNKGIYQQHLRALPGIRFPVLLIWGNQDPIVPVAHASAVSRLLPCAHVHCLDRCGHLPMFEKPYEVNRLLMNFIREEREGLVAELPVASPVATA
jgi:pimeloyl-ACP methyl ester carboxylesterase